MLCQVLYMAAMTGITYNIDLKGFYQRLTGEGKPGKVALVAVMRKLMTMLNSVMTRQTPWIENRQESA